MMSLEVDSEPAAGASGVELLSDESLSMSWSFHSG
jgi:hypothetical protein